MMIVTCFQSRFLEIPHNFPNPTHNFSTLKVQLSINNIQIINWSVRITSDSNQIYLLWRKVSLTVNLLVIVNQVCLSQKSSNAVNKTLSPYFYVLSAVYAPSSYQHLPCLFPQFRTSLSTESWIFCSPSPYSFITLSATYSFICSVLLSQCFLLHLFPHTTLSLSIQSAVCNPRFICSALL
jgi:hypothetical protein